MPASMDPNFEGRLRDLRRWAAQAAAALQAGQQSQWFRPAGYNGDALDLAGLAAAFDRSKANQDVVDALDNDNPGTAAALVAQLTALDQLGCLERACRARLGHGRPRALAHALARLQGHGTDAGPLVAGTLQSVRDALGLAAQGVQA